AAASTCCTSRGSTGCTRCPSSWCRRARSPTSTRATAIRCRRRRRSAAPSSSPRAAHPLPPTQTLGRTVACNHFQDAGAFLASGGQRGRQRAFLREGVFAVNLALFVVITEEFVLSGPVKDAANRYTDWHRQLQAMNAFSPVVTGHGGSRHTSKEEREDVSLTS